MDTPAQAAVRIAESVEEDILFGRLRPRERLIEDELIARFATTRHIARQALTELERMGVAVRIRNKGAIVRDFSRNEVEEITAVREVLHAHAAALIPLPADKALLARMEKLQRAHSEAVAKADPGRIHRANSAFHDALFAACGNAYLVQTIRDYAQLSLAFRCQLMTSSWHAQRARDEHLAMIRALKSGDRKTLQRLCVEHIRPSKQVYMTLQGWTDAEPAGTTRLARLPSRK